MTLDAQDIAPQVTWGTNPGQVIAVNQLIPSPELFSDPVERNSIAKALGLYGFAARHPSDRRDD